MPVEPMSVEVTAVKSASLKGCKIYFAHRQRGEKVDGPDKPGPLL
jgi:hypothetical protein